MIVEYPCPLSSRQWFYRHVATPQTADVPTDILSWTPLNWADMSERTGPGLTAAQVIDAHLVTHSPVQWMVFVLGERRRAEDAEATADRLLDAQEKTAATTAGAESVTSLWLPSREQVETTQTALLGMANGGAADV